MIGFPVLVFAFFPLQYFLFFSILYPKESFEAIFRNNLARQKIALINIKKASRGHFLCLF